MLLKMMVVMLLLNHRDLAERLRRKPRYRFVIRIPRRVGLKLSN